LARNSTCFGQFVCPSSGVYSLYTQQWYMSYRFVNSFRAGPSGPGKSSKIGIPLAENRQPDILRLFSTNNNTTWLNIKHNIYSWKIVVWHFELFYIVASLPLSRPMSGAHYTYLCVFKVIIIVVCKRKCEVGRTFTGAFWDPQLISSLKSSKFTRRTKTNAVACVLAH
jgi:hypothetical protein